MRALSVISLALPLHRWASRPMFNSAYAVLGVVLLGLGLFAGTVKARLHISEPMLALTAGVLVGPELLDLVDPARWGSDPLAILDQVARLSLAISLVGVALRLPDTYVRTHWRKGAMVLLVVMPLMWLVSSVLAWAVLGWEPLLALVLGAVVTPTDPVVASSIVTGELAERTIPARIRNLLSLESGANDGLAYLLLAGPILLLNLSPHEAARELVVQALLREVTLAIGAGVLLGWSIARLRLWSERRGFGERPALLGIGFAMALAVLGLLGAVGSDGILGVFAAGLAFNWIVREQEEARTQHIQEVLTRFFDLPVFILLGTMLPWHAWRELGWSAAAFAAALLLLRRLPAVLALRRWLTPEDGLPAALFFGWFGPLGVAALLWSTVAVARTGNREIWVVGSLMVVVSVVIFGVTSPPASRLLARHTAGPVRQRSTREAPHAEPEA